MNPNPSTAQLPLRDIHLPDPVSWWPPAVGWWLVLALLIILPFVVHWLRTKPHQRPLRKLALRELQGIKTAYLDHQDDTRLVRDVSTLLRRTGMSYLPRQQSASLTGEQWVERLNSLSDQPVLDADMERILATAPYRRHSRVDTHQLLDHVQQWMNGLPRRPVS